VFHQANRQFRGFVLRAVPGGDATRSTAGLNYAWWQSRGGGRQALLGALRSAGLRKSILYLSNESPLPMVAHFLAAHTCMRIF